MQWRNTLSTSLARTAASQSTQRHEIDELLPTLIVMARRFCRSERDAKTLVTETISRGKVEAANVIDSSELKLSLFKIMHGVFLGQAGRR